MKSREEHLLVCYRREFRLELWKTDDEEPKLVRSYAIAVGQQGYRTDPGVHVINSRSRAPDWRMPDSPWVEEKLRGTVIPAGDPANPIVGRWLGFGDSGEGIHGTNAGYSLGTAASHGCIRMDPSAVEELYPHVPLGTILTVY